MKVSELVMKTCTYTLNVESSVSPEFIDITDDVQGFIQSSGVTQGMVVVFSKHTTAAVVIQENEPLLLEDFKGLLEKIASSDASYRHNDFDVRTCLLYTSPSPRD